MGKIIDGKKISEEIKEVKRESGRIESPGEKSDFGCHSSRR